MFETGDHSTAELADLIGVGRSTVYRAIERQRARAATPPAPPAVAASRR